MKPHSNAPEAIHSMFERVLEVNRICKNLTEILNRQMLAVVSSDSEQIFEQAERYAEKQSEYIRAERAFIEEIERCQSSNATPPQMITLSKLREMYPDCAPVLAQWQDKLSENLHYLQRRQEQMRDLLEFAQLQNASIMKSLYEMYSGPNVHYSQKGEKSGVWPGMALNQKG